MEQCNVKFPTAVKTTLNATQVFGSHCKSFSLLESAAQMFVKLFNGSKGRLKSNRVCVVFNVIKT